MTKSKAVQLAGTHLAAAGGYAAAAIGVARLPTHTARGIRNGGIVMLTAIGLTSTPAAGAAVLSALPLMITAAVATVGARKAFDAMFDLDVVLTPSAMGEAPVGVDPRSTGDERDVDPPACPLPRGAGLVTTCRNAGRHPVGWTPLRRAAADGNRVRARADPRSRRILNGEVPWNPAI